MKTGTEEPDKPISCLKRPEESVLPRKGRSVVWLCVQSPGGLTERCDFVLASTGQESLNDPTRETMEEVLLATWPRLQDRQFIPESLMQGNEWMLLNQHRKQGGEVQMC